MRKNRKPENYYELIGADFDSFMSEYDVNQRIDKIRSLIPRNFNGTTLEVGCGTGAITRGISDLVGQLTVSDISEKLALAVAREVGCFGIQANATSLPWSDSTFDMVISSECVEHTPSPVQSIREMVRVCKPGGYLLVTTPNLIWYPVVKMAQITGLRKFQGNEIFLSSRVFKNSFTGENCQILRITGCHLFPWQVPYSKKILSFIDKFGEVLYPVMINQIILAKKN